MLKTFKSTCMSKFINRKRQELVQSMHSMNQRKYLNQTTVFGRAFFFSSPFFQFSPQKDTRVNDIFPAREH